MKELFDLLEKNERKILILFCLLLAAGLIFHQGFALRQKNVYSHSVESLAKQQKEFDHSKESNREIKKELLQWDEAKRDIADIQKKYFFKEDKRINRLRLDLREIFRKASVRIISDLMFDYTDWEGDLKKVRVHFTIAGSYFALKRMFSFFHL